MLFVQPAYVSAEHPGEIKSSKASSRFQNLISSLNTTSDTTKMIIKSQALQKVAETKHDYDILMYGGGKSRFNAGFELLKTGAEVGLAILPLGRGLQLSAINLRAMLFGRTIEIFSRGTESAANFASKNHISGLQLRQQLQAQQASSIFTKEGYLTEEAIGNSGLLPIGQLKNPKLIEELSLRPGNLSDWGKYATESTPSPSGNFQMHFYRNHVTGDVYYGRDYKAIFDHQGMWNASLKPKFDYKPLRYY